MIIYIDLYSIYYQDARAGDATEQQDEDDHDSDDEDIGEGSMDMSSVIPIGIEHQRCGAHTIQLAVKDGIDNSRANNLIHAARNVVKEGRKPTISEVFRKQAQKTLIIDVETRWGSTYLMLERLVELEPFIQEKIILITVK